MKPSLLLIALFLFCSSERVASQWVESTGSLPQNSSPKTLAFSGSNLFAGMREGVFLSTDNGTSWVEVNNGLKQPYHDPYVNALVVLGMNIYAGTQDGVFRSTNNGTNWTQSGDISHSVTALSISGINIFAGTYYGIYMSTDNGISWKIAGNSPIQTSINAFAVIGTNLFVATNSGIFLSPDNGTSWIPKGLTKDTAISLTASGTNLLAGTGQGVFRSTDNGTNWDSTDLKDKYVYSFAVSDANIFAGTHNGVFLSTDNGISWAQSGLSGFYISTLLSNSGSNVFASTYRPDEDLFISTDNGKKWSRKDRFPNQSDILNLAVSNNNLFACTAYNGSFISQNNGRSWNSAALVLASYYGFPFVGSATDMFVGTDIGLFLSTNNDTSWSQTSLKNRIGALTVSGVNIFAGTDSGVFISTDEGISWERVYMGLTRSKNIYSLIASGPNLFAVTDSGVFLSTNNGGSWTNIGLSAVRVRSFVVSGTNFFAGTDSGFFLSSNNGISWTRAGFSDTVVWSVVVVGSNIFVSTGPYNDNVFLSTDNGVSWKTVNQGLPDDEVDNVNFLVVLGSELFAGTGSHCVWRRPLTEMISADNVRTSTDINSPVTHVQNIPNPFDATTKITFDLERSAFVSLKILDILGREVSVLASEELSAGSYSRNWNASAFPPGEYFYRLQAGMYSETNKLMLVK